jgi:hypothetical protein
MRVNFQNLCHSKCAVFANEGENIAGFESKRMVKHVGH